MTLRWRGIITLGLCFAVAGPALGQLFGPSDRVERIPGGMLAQPASPGDDGLPEEAAAVIRYDDGEADLWIKSGATTYEVAMLFPGVGGPDVTLGSVDFCWREDGFGADSRIRYEVVVWAANGPGGVPGTELAKFAAVANGVTSTPMFYNTSVNHPLTTSDVYIGVRYNPAVDPSFWFCVDTDGIGGAPPQPGYRRANESGGWSTISSIAGASAYKALMVRAYVYTPGVVAETVLVPYFLVDRSQPFGTTTVFAVRNLTGDPISGTVEYLTVAGASQRLEMLSLGPFETKPVNVRDIPGLAIGMDGYARGYVEVTTAGNPDMTPVLAGDYFQVDVDNDFATGDKLVRRFALCEDATIRFLRFPLPGSANRLRVWIANPRGTAGGDPHSFTARAFDENGNPDGPAILVKTSLHALELDPAFFTTLSYGHLRFDFSNAGGGTVYAEYSTQGRFSVGVSSQCGDLP